MFDSAEALDLEQYTIVVPRYRIGIDRDQSKLSSSKGDRFSNVDDVFETLLQKDKYLGAA